MPDLFLSFIIAGIFINGLSLFVGLRHIYYMPRPTDRAKGVATLILPLTGRAPGFPALVAAINSQTLTPRRLIVAVESQGDPAYQQAMVSRVSAQFPIEIAIAGEAVYQAQKCANLVAAIELVDDQDDVVVFLDGDIMPPSWWLSSLVAPITNNSADLVTGYRWQSVRHFRFGAFVIAAIDRSLAIIPRVNIPLSRVVWGGSYAVTPETLIKMDLARSFQTTLSDDLKIAERAGHLGLRIMTPSALLVPSPNDQTLTRAWHFGRRQYQMIWLYRPVLWWLAMATTLVRLLAWGVAMAASWTIALWALACLAMLAFMKQLTVQIIDRKLGFSMRRPFRLMFFGLAIVQPIVDLFHLSMIIAGGWARRVKWGHITYEADGQRGFKVSKRRAWNQPTNQAEP